MLILMKKATAVSYLQIIIAEYFKVTISLFFNNIQFYI